MTIQTEECRIHAALTCIPADLSRDEWARIGTALKHELGDAGFDLFDAWSKGGVSYDAAAARSTWRSLSAGGGITIATLFHVAKQHGFDTRNPDAATIDSAEQMRRHAEREQRAAKDGQKRETRALAAAGLSEAVWRAASPVAADHPYLTRKGVQTTDTLREIDAGKLKALIGYQPNSGDEPLEERVLIAPVHVGNKLCSLEMIDGDGRKSALAGGVKAGGHWAAQEMPDTLNVLLIAEGVATALSASQCSDFPAIAALSVGQLTAAVRAMRERYPDAVLVVLADLDKVTGEPHPVAIKAAKAAGVRLAVPVFEGYRQPDQTDFNDLHASCGADAVKAQIEAALADCAINDAQRGRAPDEGGDSLNRVEPYYETTDQGLFYIGVKVTADQATYTAPTWLCDPIEVLGSGSDSTDGEVRVLKWLSGSGKEVVRALPCADIGETSGWVRLRANGVMVSPSRSARERLAGWLQQENRRTRYQIASTTGWQSGAYILPTGEFIGQPNALLHFNGKPNCPEAYHPCGSLEGWRDSIGRLARGNAIPMTAIACALVGPLLPIAGEKDGIGVHLYARTSRGKSTTGEAAASVWGDPRKTKMSWTSTTLGYGLNAEAANHRLLFLDELGSGKAQQISPALYLMLNGQSKSQGARDGGMVAPRTWLTAFISTGEVTISRYLQEGGMIPRGGQEVRMLDVPADSGAHGVFDSLHEFAEARDLANALETATTEQYGTAGRAFVEWLAPRWAEARAAIDRERERMANMVPNGAAPPVFRATKKFAALSAAAVLASQAGITGWSEDEARAAVDMVWKRWLDAFGTGDRDDARLIEQADAALRENEYGRFVLISTDTSANEPSIRDLMGYRRYGEGGATFYVLPHAFAGVVTVGYDLLHACRVLHEAGMLDRSEKRRSYKVNAGRYKGSNIGDVYRMRPRAGEAPPDEGD